MTGMISAMKRRKTAYPKMCCLFLRAFYKSIEMNWDSLIYQG